jgi:hypothetical protein
MGFSAQWKARLNLNNKPLPLYKDKVDSSQNEKWENNFSSSGKLDFGSLITLRAPTPPYNEKFRSYFK